jgi:hypothetical protein
LPEGSNRRLAGPPSGAVEQSLRKPGGFTGPEALNERIGYADKRGLCPARDRVVDLREEGREAATRRDSGLETTGRRLKTVTNPRQVRQGPSSMMGPMLETATKAPIAFSSRSSFRWKFAEEKPTAPPIVQREID